MTTSDMITVITRPCIRCGKPSTLEVDSDAYGRWAGGEVIQRAFPTLTSDERELLVTGTHGSCWALMFPEEEEE